jgi:hypothetical protein
VTSGRVSHNKKRQSLHERSDPWDTYPSRRMASHALVAQWREQKPSKLWVAGSSPAGGAQNMDNINRWAAGTRRHLPGVSISRSPVPAGQFDVGSLGTATPELTSRSGVCSRADISSLPRLAAIKPAWSPWAGWLTIRSGPSSRLQPPWVWVGPAGLSGAGVRGHGSNRSRRGHGEPTMGSSNSGMPLRRRSRISRVVST